MKGDYEVVMAAVTQDGYALHYATAELRRDADLIKAALGKQLWGTPHCSEGELALGQVLLSDL